MIRFRIFCRKLEKDVGIDGKAAKITRIVGDNDLYNDKRDSA
jgi:hypothetical protein